MVVQFSFFFFSNTRDTINFTIGFFQELAGFFQEYLVWEVLDVVI